MTQDDRGTSQSCTHNEKAESITHAGTRPDVIYKGALFISPATLLESSPSLGREVTGSTVTVSGDQGERARVSLPTVCIS